MRLQFLVLQLLLLTEHIHCSGKGEIQLYMYTDSTNCGDADCDFYFKNFLIQNEEGNEFLNVVKTDDTGNTDTIYFSTVEQLDEVIPVNIHTGRSITISFEVWDQDTGNADDYVRTMSGLVVPFSSIRSGETLKEKSFISNTNAENENREATLWIRYRIVSCDSPFTGLGCNSCVANYYGTECSKYCKDTPGYYRCGSSGEKVCEERRTGDICDSCITGFTGESCQSCSDNFYPEGECDVHCPPDLDKYTCTNQGSKECLVNREGTNCEDCVANHYGEDCTKFCQETSYFSCDESGEKDCKENFYPPQKCDTRCVPVTGNYTCNQITGEKICMEGKEGEDCDECQNRNKEGGNCDKCIENHDGENCTVYCKPDDYFVCSEIGHKICLDNSTSVANNCREGKAAQHNIGVWISSGVAAIFFSTSIMAGLYILHLRRKLENVSASNVIYANTAVPNPAKTIPTTEHNYDNVVLRVTSATNGHLYNDVVIQTEPAPDESAYDYVRIEDVVRHNIR